MVVIKEIHFKENDVGRNLLIFSMKTKNRKDVQNNTEAAPFN
jgi:hypothetical protein